MVDVVGGTAFVAEHHHRMLSGEVVVDGIHQVLDSVGFRSSDEFLIDVVGHPVQLARPVRLDLVLNIAAVRAIVQEVAEDLVDVVWKRRSRKYH